MMRLLPLLAIALCLVWVGVAAHAESLVPPPDVPLSTTPDTEAMARLVVSRDNLAPKQSIAVDVPPGEVAISVARGGSGYCVSDMPANSQSAVFTPGETREFR